FGEARSVFGALLDGAVEAVKTAQKFVAVECAPRQRGDHFFNLGGDNVPAAEIWIVENLSEDTLGEEVLHEHPFHGFFREVGIDGLAAEREEVVKAADERRIALALLVDCLLDRGGEFRNAV